MPTEEQWRQFEGDRSGATPLGKMEQYLNVNTHPAILAGWLSNVLSGGSLFPTLLGLSRTAQRLPGPASPAPVSTPSDLAQMTPEQLGITPEEHAAIFGPPKPTASGNPWQNAEANAPWTEDTHPIAPQQNPNATWVSHLNGEDLTTYGPFDDEITAQTFGRDHLANIGGDWHMHNEPPFSWETTQPPMPPKADTPNIPSPSIVPNQRPSRGWNNPPPWWPFGGGGDGPLGVR